MQKFLIILSFFFVSGVFAQQEELETELVPVTITATKTETSVNELASSITVLSAAQIEKMKVNTVTDLLRNVEGINLVEQGGQGQLTSVFTRGTNSNHTLVLLDGVELNDPAAAGNLYDFSTLQLNNVERIEIVRGNQSTLYGSDAIGGVINIITKSGAIGKNLVINAEMGSNAFYKWNGSILGNSGIFDYSVNYSYQQAEGISAADEANGNTEKDGFRAKSFSSRIGLNFSENSKLTLIYKYSANKADIDQSAKLGDDPNYEVDNEEQVWRAEFENSFINDILCLKAGGSYFRRFGYQKDETDSRNPFTSSLNHTDANKIKTDIMAVLNLPFNKVSIGIENEIEEAASEYYSNSMWGPYQSILPVTETSNFALFLQDQFNYQNLFVTAGIRNDNHKKFGSKASFRVAPAYFINETGTKVKFTYGTGFKSPSLYQLFEPLSGNTELKPEESKGWDAGIEQYLLENKLSAGVTYFFNDIKNLIGFDPLTYKSININKAETKGLEAVLRVNDFYNFDFNANYTLTKTKDLGVNTEDAGKKLLRRAEHTFNLNLNYKLFTISDINVNYRYVGKREDKDFEKYQRITLPAYGLVDINASIKILDKFKVYGKIKNLFDKDYQEVFLYGTPGRTFYAGIVLDLK